MRTPSATTGERGRAEREGLVAAAQWRPLRFPKAPNEEKSEVASKQIKSVAVGQATVSVWEVSS
ncbi:MAG: hypothetical protein ACRDJH_12605 [Thermomicrobiales bacterium]